MAHLLKIDLPANTLEVLTDKVEWIPSSHESEQIKGLPQLVWEDGETWGEANLWALHQARMVSKHIKTVQSAMAGLLTYANWLEAENIAWWHFPVKQSERCLYKYRGALISARDNGDIAPSTASSRMSTVVRFYRWVEHHGLISPDFPMWAERHVGLQTNTSFGLQRTLNVRSTDLAIPNRKVIGAFHTEGALMPVTQQRMNEIIQFVSEHGSEELALMIRLGFCTGLRIGSILDLKDRTLANVTTDPETGVSRIHLGPGASPPVRTKFGITGNVPIPNFMLDDLRAYSISTRRLLRQSKAAKEHKKLLFLNKYGRPYEDVHQERNSITQLMSELRKNAENQGVSALKGFKFHQTRATFATELMRACLEHFLNVSDAIVYVRDACLHKNESTTMGYVHFIESSAAAVEASEKFGHFLFEGMYETT